MLTKPSPLHQARSVKPANTYVDRTQLNVHSGSRGLLLTECHSKTS